MGKMYTLHPNESIHDHMTESITMLNELAKSVGVGYYRNSATIHGMKPDSIRFVIEHVRNTIEMLDELCDDLEDDKDEIRREYEEKVIQFFNRFMDSDLDDEYNFRMKEVVRNIHEIENHYMEEIQELTKKSNQLEEHLTVIKGERDIAKKLAKKLIDEKRVLKDDLMRSELECKNLKAVLDKKYAEIEELTAEIM